MLTMNLNQPDIFNFIYYGVVFNSLMISPSIPVDGEGQKEKRELLDVSFVVTEAWPSRIACRSMKLNESKTKLLKQKLMEENLVSWRALLLLGVVVSLGWVLGWAHRWAVTTKPTVTVYPTLFSACRVGFFHWTGELSAPHYSGLALSFPQCQHSYSIPFFYLGYFFYLVSAN